MSLWAAGFLTGITVAQAARVGLQAKWVGREREVAAASMLACSGAAYARWQLAADGERTWDAAVEDWAHPERWMPAFTDQQDRWTAVVSDADGALNLNEVLDKVPDATLDQLPALAGFTFERFAQRLRAAIRGDTPRPLAHVEELVTRVGVPRDGVAKLRPLVRTQGGAAVNVNGTTAKALAALGLPMDIAEELIKIRDGGDGTEDDVVFRSADPNEVRTVLVGHGMDEGRASQVMALFAQGLVGVASSSFRIEATGVTVRHGIRRVVTAILLRPSAEERVTTIRWEEV